MIFDRILKWFEHRFYCQVCMERSIFNHHKKCSSCNRRTCKSCITDTCDKGLNSCLYCGESWIKKEVVFKPKQTISEFRSSFRDGLERSGIRERLIENGLLSPNESRELIGGMSYPRQQFYNDRLDGPDDDLEAPTDLPIMRRSRVRIGDQVIEPLDLEIQVHHNHQQIRSGFGLEERTVLTGPSQLSGTITLHLDSLDTSIFNINGSDDIRFSVHHGNQLIARDCYIQNYQMSLDNNVNTVEIDWIGIPP